MKAQPATFRACDTGVYFLQTRAAAAAWPVTDAKLAELRRAFEATNEAAALRLDDGDEEELEQEQQQAGGARAPPPRVPAPPPAAQPARPAPGKRKRKRSRPSD